MFSDLSIVSTAMSSFNNAALYNPLFFGLAILMLPLFFLVYLYGNDFVGKLGWNKNNMETKIGFWASLILMLWMLVFGGNYAAIRDGISLLPILMSFVLFVLMIFVTNKAIELKYVEKISKYGWGILLLLIVLAVFSGPLSWTGILMQASAILCGAIIGGRVRKFFSPVFFTSGAFLFLTALILMQPEYFRFGQLGNLTIVHLFAVLFVGFCAITTLVSKYTNARSKIYASAYIKLKWLFRIVALLALVLFVSTESVPVFVALMAVLGVLEMLSIYHSSNKFNGLAGKAWAMLLISFGILIICPVISAMGIIYLQDKQIKASDFTGLL